MPHDQGEETACLQKMRAAGLAPVGRCGKCGSFGGAISCAEVPPEERARRMALLLRARAAVALQREMRQLASGPMIEFSSVDALLEAVNQRVLAMKKSDDPA